MKNLPLNEIEKLKINSSVIVVLGGHLMQYVFDENMKMKLVTEPVSNSRKKLMEAMILDIANDLARVKS